MLQLFEYELPFLSVFQTGSSEFRSRKGVLLHCKESNVDFIVEASPLPGFSRESFSEVKQILFNHKKFIEDFLSSELSLQKIRNLANVKALNIPSIQYSISYLSLSIFAHRLGKTFYDLFDKKLPQQIPINDVIGYAPAQEMRNRIESSINQGFRVIKVKAPHPVDELVNLLDPIYKNHPQVQFRLDANQNWPKSELEKNCNKLQHLPVEYIEEPCKIKGVAEIREVQKTAGLPIALDESISTIKELKQVLHQFPDLILIIKPMLLGNFLEIHETISQIRSSSKQIVVTTTLESRIGRSMIASTASLIGDQQMSHGLHTGHLFADDLLPDFEIENGSIQNLRENPALQSFNQIKTSFLKKLG